MNRRIFLDLIAPPLFIGGAFAACSSSPSPEARQAEAEAKYGAAQLDCVADAGTLAESKACRARVDAEYGVKPRVNVPPAMLLPLDGGK